MEIAFHPKIRKICEDEKEATRKLGSERARLLKRRLVQLRYAESLEDMRNLPQTRCHELRGDRAGQLVLDLKHPYRLIFEVTDDPAPTNPAGGLDWKAVRSVSILEVVDYHD